MSTLEEARKSSRRYHTFVGKPRKVVSGKPLTKIRQSSQRSEVFMDDQIEMVQELQDHLQQAMVHLMEATSDQDTQYWRTQVDDLRARSDELVLILKVVGKLNSELVYAKMRLRDALRRGDDVVSIRKRVIWLEERIHQLLKKYYTNIPPGRVSSVPEEPVAMVSPIGDTVPQLPASIDRGGHVGGSLSTNRMAAGDATTVLPALHSGGITALTQQEPKVELEEPSIFMTEEIVHGIQESSKSPILLDKDENGNTTRGVNDGSSDTTDWEAEKNEDGGYWQSPHHRFDFNEQFDAITSENPLSYHNLGLAVTSSFIKPAPRTGSELPWQQMEDGADINSQQLAMEKISDRIQEIIGQMEEAALKSAEYEPPPIEGRQSKLLNMIGSCNDTVLKVPGAEKRSSPSVKTNAAADREITLPPVGSRSTNPNARSVKYYPKPVPSSELLPITRMNREKKYPRVSTDWNDTPPEDMEPTVSVVNQKNATIDTSPIARRRYKGRSASPPKGTNGPSGLSSPSNKMPHTTGRKEDQGSLDLAGLIGARCHSGVINLDRGGPKWERVMKMLSNLESGRVEERRDTARNLGALDCCEPSVVTALTERLRVDADSRVRYESAKSIISLGFWSPLPVTMLVKYLRNGTDTTRLDVVRTITSARNTHVVDEVNNLKALPEFVSDFESLPAVRELISTLVDLCATRQTEDNLAHTCAVCLGRLGVMDQGAEQRLLRSLTSEDTHVIAPSLELLVRLYHQSGPDVLDAIVDQLQNSTVWKHRVAAAKLLGVLGQECYQNYDTRNKVLDILSRQLYNDPIQRLRAEVAATLTALGMRDWIVEQVQKELFSEDGSCRAHAVISVGVLGLKKDRTIGILLNLLDIEPCEYVRLQVVRTLAALGATRPTVIRALRDRERAGGPLAREATKALRSLVAMSASRGTGRSPPGGKKMRSFLSSPAFKTNSHHTANTEIDSTM